MQHEIRILIDMNLSPSWTAAFEEAKINAIHWSSIGASNAPDKELFDWAREKGHVVFTHDLDFGAILAATKLDAPSVIQIRTQDIMPDAAKERVIETIRSNQDYLIAGALITIDEIRSRIRILPLP